MALMLNEQGYSGLKEQSGYLYEECLNTLRGKNGKRAMHELVTNDPVASASLWTLRAMLKQARWAMQPNPSGQTTEEDLQLGDAIQADMDIPLVQSIDEMASGFTYGFAPMEIMLKKVSNGIGISRFELRGQETIDRWDIDDKGNIKGFWQLTDQGQSAYIPRNKFILFRTTVEKNNPEGLSLFRGAYTSYYRKKGLMTILSIASERGAMGYPVARIPGEYLDDEASSEKRATGQSFQTLVQSMKIDSEDGVTIPSDKDENGKPLFDIEFISTPRVDFEGLLKVISYLDNSMAKSISTQFIQLGGASGGSQAIIAEQTRMFSRAIEGYLKNIALELNTVLQRVWVLNNRPLATCPVWTPSIPLKQDIRALGSLINILGKSVNLNFGEESGTDILNEVLHQAGLPQSDSLYINSSTP